MNNLLVTFTAGQSVGILFAMLFLIAIIIAIVTTIKDSDESSGIIIDCSNNQNKKNTLVKSASKKMRGAYDKVYVEKNLKTTGIGAIAKANDDEEVVEELKQKTVKIARAKKVKVE